MLQSPCVVTRAFSCFTEMAAASESLSWVCEAQLGSGGFGIVHVWRNAATGRKVALKKCKFGSDVTMTARHKAQWCQEVRHFWCRKFPFVIDNFLGVAGILHFLRIPFLALSIQWRPRFSPSGILHYF